MGDESLVQNQGVNAGSDELTEDADRPTTPERKGPRHRAPDRTPARDASDVGDAQEGRQDVVLPDSSSDGTHPAHRAGA